MNREKQFKDIVSKMTETFIAKNKDYGNSFDETLNDEGIVASRVRIADKFNRFKQLSKGQTAMVADESITDTLLDMANYAIMTVMWMDGKKNDADTPVEIMPIETRDSPAATNASDGPVETISDTIEFIYGYEKNR